MPEIIINGVLRTDLVLSDKVRVEIRNEIDLLDDQSNIFEFLTRQIRPIRSVKNTKTERIEQRLADMVMTVQAVDAPGTTITVDHPEYMHRDQKLFNTRNGESYLSNEDIGGVAVAGKITVVNQQTGSGAFILPTAIGDTILIGPETHAEGEVIPPSFATQPTHLWTYLYQHDRTRSNTDMERYQGEYGLLQLLIDRKTFAIEDQRAVNMELYNSLQTREILSASGARRHAMQGLRNWLSTNFINYGGVPGNFTLTSIGELMRRCTSHTSSSSVKIGIGGQNTIAALSAMPVNAIRTSVNEKSWGADIKTIVTPFKNLNWTYDQMLSNDYGMADIFVIIDPNHIERLQVEGLETHMMLNIQNNDNVHNQVDLITGTEGMFVGLEENHVWAYNIK